MIIVVARPDDVVPAPPIGRGNPVDSDPDSVIPI